jgi:hypothetical protein
MDCLQLAPQSRVIGGAIGEIISCRSQVAFHQVMVWLTANPLWTIGLLLGMFILPTVTWQLGRTMFTRQREHNTAKKRAEALLRSSITAEQYQQLIDRGYLEIPSRLYSGYLYRIPRNQQRVQIYETSQASSIPYSRKLAELCVIPCDPVPDADMVLAHKLMIEADEQSYLSIANRIG